MDRAALPQYFVEHTCESDREYRKLTSAFKATRIKEYLELGKKNWYGLRPSWVEPSEENGLQRLVEKEEALTFFLNPRDQKNHRHGWFNLHELEEWAEGKGIVFKEGDKDIKDLYPDWEERLRAHLYPKGYEAATKAAENAGLDMNWSNVSPIAFALRPFLCDGNVLGKVMKAFYGSIPRNSIQTEWVGSRQPK